MKTEDVTAKGVPAAALKSEKRKRLLNQLLSQKFLYLMILPGLIYFIVFKYVPMWGLIIAFQDYQPFLGILGSEWVGFKHFIRLFTEPTFFILLKNTLILFAMNVVIFFPIPILL
ncbi:sugar ABC transporter permease, partial [Bacillus safensis]